MLNKWLKALDDEKQGSLERLAAVCKDRETADLAIQKIELDYLSVRNWVMRINACGYRLNDDLSRIDSDYDAFEDYRELVNHLSYHLRELRRVPIEVEKGHLELMPAKFC